MKYFSINQIAILFVFVGMVFFLPAAKAADCAGAEKGSKIIKFDLGSAAVSDTEKAVLKEFAETAKLQMVVCVSGQADKQGDPKYNKELATRRANAVAKILEENGVPKERIQIVSRGEAFSGNLKMLPPAETDRRVKVSYGN
jgi:outer membrane protein OmpA-like peptidoglycan-associated protein